MRPIYYNLYWLRAIAALSVVLIHSITITLLRFDITVVHYSHYIQLSLMFATPVFVIISEFLSANHYNDKLPKDFLSKRFKVLLPAYISIGFVFAILFSDSLTEFLHNAFRHIILADSIAYFIIIILQFNILHYFLSGYLKNIKPYKYLLVTFIINIGYLAFFKVIPNPFLSWDYFWIKGYFMLFPAWIFYFAFGYYLGTNYKKLKDSFNRLKWVYLTAIILFAIPIIGFKYFGIMSTVSSKRIDMLLYTASIVLFILAVFHNVKHIPKPIEVINKYSFNIYLIHTIPMNLITFKLSNNFWMNVLLLFLIGIVSSILISEILNRSKYGYLIVGKQLKVRK